MSGPIVPDEDLTHADDCTVKRGAQPHECTCGAYAAQQMTRLEAILRRSGILS